MNFETMLETALVNESPVLELRSQLQILASQGIDKSELLGKLEQARARFRQLGRETDENIVTDAMDFVVGWCSPHVSISPAQHHVPSE